MLIAASNMHEYFREALEAAAGRTSVQLSSSAQVYLVYMLCEFARSEKAYAGTERGEVPTFALLLVRAMEANNDEAVRIYKHIGDSSLYELGFFSERAKSKVVSEEYVISMGETAYSSVAHLVRDQAAKQAALYSELADRFLDLIKLFNVMSLYGKEKSEKANLPSAQLLELVEQYEKTKNPQILAILKGYGIIWEKGS